MAEVKIQLNAVDGSLWYQNTIEKMSESELAEIRSVAGDYWWTENDEISMLTVYMDGSYLCERRKRVWSYRNGSYTFTHYKFTHPSKEEVLKFSEVLLEKFSELRIRKLKEQSDKVAGVLAEQYNGVVASLKGFRNRMLIDTDWTQLLDAPISEEDRELYKTFRKYLRDMPADPAWMGNDVFQIDFPITPKVYLEKCPNRDVEYLSVPEHFENQAAMQLKFKMTRIFSFLKLPTLTYGKEEFENATYEELKEKLDSYLKKIDGNLEFNIQFKQFDNEDIPLPTGPSSDYTIDDINEAAS